MRQSKEATKMLQKPALLGRGTGRESAAQPSLLTPMPSLPFKSRRPGQPRIPWAPANRNLSLVEQTLVKGAYAKKRPMKDRQGHPVSVDIAICWGSMATWPGRKRHLGVNVERQLLLQHCWLELLDNPVQPAACLNSVSPLQTDWFALIGLIWRHNWPLVNTVWSVRQFREWRNSTWRACGGKSRKGTCSQVRIITTMVQKFWTLGCSTLTVKSCS